MVCAERSRPMGEQSRRRRCRRKEVEPVLRLRIAVTAMCVLVLMVVYRMRRGGRSGTGRGVVTVQRGANRRTADSTSTSKNGGGRIVDRLFRQRA